MDFGSLVGILFVDAWGLLVGHVSMDRWQERGRNRTPWPTSTDHCTVVAVVGATCCCNSNIKKFLLSQLISLLPQKQWKKFECGAYTRLFVERILDFLLVQPWRTGAPGIASLRREEIGLAPQRAKIGLVDRRAPPVFNRRS